MADPEALQRLTQIGCGQQKGLGSQASVVARVCVHVALQFGERHPVRLHVLFDLADEVSGAHLQKL